MTQTLNGEPLCDCELYAPDPDEDPDDDMYYPRTCEACGQDWLSLHCAHDGHQNPCAHCGHVHAPA